MPIFFLLSCVSTRLLRLTRFTSLGSIDDNYKAQSCYGSSAPPGCVTINFLLVVKFKNPETFFPRNFMQIVKNRLNNSHHIRNSHRLSFTLNSVSAQDFAWFRFKWDFNWKLVTTVSLQLECFFGDYWLIRKFIMVCLYTANTTEVGRLYTYYLALRMRGLSSSMYLASPSFRRICPPNIDREPHVTTLIFFLLREIK